MRYYIHVERETTLQRNFRKNNAGRSDATHELLREVCREFNQVNNVEKPRL